MSSILIISLRQPVILDAMLPIRKYKVIRALCLFNEISSCDRLDLLGEGDLLVDLNKRDCIDL